jgi:hypothetical protein
MQRYIKILRIKHLSEFITYHKKQLTFHLAQIQPFIWRKYNLSFGGFSTLHLALFNNKVLKSIERDISHEF